MDQGPTSNIWFKIIDYTTNYITNYMLVIGIYIYVINIFLCFKIDNLCE
jgi:hypothetical protein